MAATPIHPKVISATTAAAVTTILVFAAAQAGLDIPPAVAAAITTLIAFAGGYLKSA